MKLRFSPFHLIILTFFFSLLMIASCSKEKSRSASDIEQEVNASKASSESDAEAELVFNGIFDDAIGVNDEVGMAGTGVFGRLTACYTVTVTHLNAGNVFPIRIVVDFGTTGCLGNDGHVRRGKVITEYTNRLLYPGAIATTTFDGFYVDSIHVQGRHKITNTSSPVTNPPNRQFTVEVDTARLSRPNGDYSEWNSHKVITQIEGLDTHSFPLDDVFKIEGTAHGRVKRGALLVAWESNVTESLIKRFNCRWIVKGKIRTVRLNTTNSPWVAVLDFGDGNCDNRAVITINGIRHEITLR